MTGPGPSQMVWGDGMSEFSCVRHWLEHVQITVIYMASDGQGLVKPQGFAGKGWKGKGQGSNI